MYTRYTAHRTYTHQRVKQQMKSADNDRRKGSLTVWLPLAMRCIVFSHICRFNIIFYFPKKKKNTFSFFLFHSLGACVCVCARVSDLFLFRSNCILHTHTHTHGTGAAQDVIRFSVTFNVCSNIRLCLFVKRLFTMCFP